MKKRWLGLLIIPLLLGGCNNQKQPDDSGEYASHTVNHPMKSGEIANFDLLGPENGFSTSDAFTFTWENCENADYYQIEIAETKSFVSDNDLRVYVKESNISLPKYDLGYSLPKKDTLYYWRITAVNSDHTKKSNTIGNFFYESKNVGEIPIVIEDAQDWTVHKEGSQATVSIDRTNFFNNNKDSLAITFDKEHTNQGISKSDGWIVITKNEDRELYGTDAFYFNFYYSGHDATILIRVLDYDGEYWHKQVRVSNNAKQTVLMKYEDFELRTAGTNIFNQVFDWQHIRYFEIVFERTFGDGICLLSDIKAVQYENYEHMFMKKMNFKRDDINEWTYENFNFDKTISEDGSEITLSYQARNEETNPNGFAGWGFQSVNVYKFFVEGDALRMNIKYTGSYATSNFYFRILEEDNDKWNFKLPFANLVRDEYKQIVIPLKAFQRMDYMNGDGAKQFFYIQKISFGLADNYSTGTLSIKDLEVIKLDDVLESRTRVVPANGCIENFEDYDVYTELYYCWDQSIENKDEAMKLDTLHKTGGAKNEFCGEFDYKADMEMAVYQIYLNTEAVENKNALSLWLKDASVKPDVAAVSYLKDDEVAAEMTIQLTMDSGEWYRYVIPKLNKEWYNYTIAFSDFELVNRSSLYNAPKDLASNHIIHMAFGFKYFYYDKDGKSYPTYAIANPVYLDEIYFKEATETSIDKIDFTIYPDENKVTTTVDTFEKYASDDDVFNNWYYGKELEYNSMTLSKDVSNEESGGKHSLKMHYKGATSVSYGRTTQLASTVQATGFSFDIKGDGKATVYINLNLKNGNKIYQLRYTLENAPTVWTHYDVGFALFKDQNNPTQTITLKTAKNIDSITFGIVNSDDTESDIYVDNIVLSKNIDYNTNEGKAINKE